MKAKTVMMAFAAGAMLLFAGCKKELKLESTQWSSVNDVDMTEVFTDIFLDEESELAERIMNLLGGKVIAQMTVNLTFTNATEGRWESDMAIKGAERLPEFIQEELDWLVQGDTTSFTYTFDGEEGSIYVDEGTDYDGTELIMVLDMSYNRDDKTLAVTPNDAEDTEFMVDMFGKSSLTFKRK